MTPSQTYVRFPAPVFLALRPRQGPRPRVVAPGDTPQPEEPQEEEQRIMREFNELPLHLQFDPIRRFLLAYLAPIPAPLVLYGPEDFVAATADTMEDHADRVLALCGDDPAAVLQPLIDADLPIYWERPAPPKRVPRAIENWRAKTMLKLMGMDGAAEAAFAGLPEQERVVVETAWNQGAMLLRKSAAVNGVGAALGLTSAQIDQLFIEAAALVV